MTSAATAFLTRVKRAVGSRAERARRRYGLRGFGGRTATAALEPVSRVFGFDRGQPIDRYYIESFLATHAADIHGRVLEAGDNTYTRRFGGERVQTADVLNTTPGPGTTVVTDLAEATAIPDEQYDCLVLTQVLPFIFDTRAVVRHCHRILKPGGVLLTTVPGISQISRYDMDRWGDFWRFTDASLRRLLEEAFPPEALELQVHGNVRVASAFLYGLATEELSTRELDHLDEDYPLIITARAVREAQ
ncbi:MAG: class I SAM-dependent methyltransferase [Planctomycetes bacterium]|nr:class I SAM-dependent methyltransferase [Planctomycetota bacterium]